MVFWPWQAGKFERLDDDDDDTGAARSIEGWVVIVSGVHEEAQAPPKHVDLAGFRPRFLVFLMCF